MRPMDAWRIISKNMVELYHTRCTSTYKGYTEDEIEAAPAVDAVEVVRCKDCKRWSVDCGTDETVCLKIYSDGAASAYAWQERRPADFCSYGKRRADDGQ